MLRRKPAVIRLLVGLGVLVSAALVVACQVPVFRYALERWAADQYRYVILCDQPLSASEQGLVDKLVSPRQSAAAGVLRVHQVTDKSDAYLQKLWRGRTAGQPLVVCLFPRTASVETTEPAFVCSLEPKAVQLISDSPVRTELRRRLQQGDSAVWLFLESGQAERDNAARQRLEASLAVQQSKLKLPTPAEMEVTVDQLQSLQVPLKLSFSILSLRRSDTAEAFLVNCLLQSEEDLLSLNEPMAFPVFGRGRVLYALVGEGISESTIADACQFLTGPCSCQVKEQNPGFDLLLPGDWERVIGDVLISDPLPTAGEGQRKGAAPQLLTIPPGRKSGSPADGGKNNP